MQIKLFDNRAKYVLEACQKRSSVFIREFNSFRKHLQAKGSCTGEYLLSLYNKAKECKELSIFILNALDAISDRRLKIEIKDAAVNQLKDANLLIRALWSIPADGLEDDDG